MKFLKVDMSPDIELTRENAACTYLFGIQINFPENISYIVLA